MGQRYSNGMLEGFLNGRGEMAMRALNRYYNGEVQLSADEQFAWMEVANYAAMALESYNANGDSDEVKDYTGKMMDACDRAIAFGKSKKGSEEED